jgi:hypothetical protein
MCVFCYVPGTAIGEITLVGGPIVGATWKRVRHVFGAGTEPVEDGASAQPEPARSHAKPAQATPAAAAAQMNATG